MKLSSAWGLERIPAKLHNYAALAVRFKLAQGDRVAEELRALEPSCINQGAIESLLGLEGNGSAVYFGAMRESLPDSWGFAGRVAHPPADPVNAMLSFGYTMLYHHLSTALIAAGLNPRIGLFHEERGAYHALTCDLEEEFRHLVDAQVWAMIYRNEVAVPDFVQSRERRYPCLMAAEFRRTFVARMEKRFFSEFTPDGGGPTTYLRFMDHQVWQIKELIRGKVVAYRPLRVHP